MKHKGIDTLGDYLEKAALLGTSIGGGCAVNKADDGKPGESLGETSTKELKATHDDITARLKQDPDNKALQARYNAIDGEIRKRGKHDGHTPPKHMGKAMPSEEAKVSPEKAKKILKDGEVNGHPLTEAQRGMFGAIAGKAKKGMAGLDEMGDYLEKAKYIKRTGTPGNYRYTYPDDAKGRESGGAGSGASPESGDKALASKMGEAVADKIKQHRNAILDLDLSDRGTAVKLYGALTAATNVRFNDSSLAAAKNWTDARIATIVTNTIKKELPQALPYFAQHKIDKRNWGEAPGGGLPGTPGNNYKTEKSMDGIEGLGDFLKKGTGATVAETVTSSPQHNLGDETDAIDGDDESGKGALPHGETQYFVTTEADGGYNELQEHTTGSGPVDWPTSGESPTAIANWGSNGSLSEKSMPTGDLRQHEQVARAVALRKSELTRGDDVIYGGSELAPEPEPEMQMSKSWRQGDLVSYTDFSDLAAAKLVKSEEFYHGPPPSLEATGLLRKSSTCSNGHVMPAMLTSCPGCGVGSQFNARTSMAPGGRGLVKSMRGLQPAFEADLVLPAGTVVIEE